MSRRAFHSARVRASFVGPMTQAELCKAAQTSQAVVSRTLAAMMSADPREAHIGNWKPAKTSGGPPVAVYYRGPGLDKDCDIRPLSAAERTRRCREQAAKKPRADWSGLGRAFGIGA